MKKLIISSLIMASTIGSVFAGCENAYTEYLRGASQREADRIKYNRKMENISIGGSVIGAFTAVNVGGNIVMSTVAGVGEGSALMSTAVAPFFVAGAVLGGLSSVKIAEHFVDGEKSPSEAEKLGELTGALRLIKEAQAGQGTILESYMPIIWKEVNSSVALTDFSLAINTLNSENAFCQNTDELDAKKGIIEKAINVLKSDK